MPETLINNETFHRAAVAPEFQYAQKDRLIDEVARRYYDAATEAAEVLDGVMHTEIPLAYDGNDIYSRKDGTRFGDMMHKSIEAAWKIADKQPNLFFELRRRQKEADELPLMIDMAKGAGPNTLIVVSDFPQELMGQTKDIGGYNVARRQTMLRIITRKPDGDISLETQTLDGSNRRALEAIYAEFGIKPEAGELLGQRITADLEVSGQEALSRGLTNVYDKSLQRQYGGSWHAGREVDERLPRINTYDFVRSQHDILNSYIHSENYGEDKMKLGFLQILTERYEELMKPQNKFAVDKLGSGGTRDLVNTSDGSSAFIEGHNVNNELHMAAARAQQQGRVYSACGATIESKENELNDYNNSGYGNKSEESEDSQYDFSKKMHCVVCQPKPKKDDDKKMCGPCGICEGCDSKIRKSSAGQNAAMN